MPIQDMPLDRLQSWLSFWQTILISGAVALCIAILPGIINSTIKDRELTIQSADNNAKFKLKEKELASTIENTNTTTKAKIETEIINQEKSYVTEFLKYATDLNVESQILFTKYVAALTRDKTLKTGWLELHADAKEEKEKKKQDLAKAEEDVTKKKGEELEVAKAEVARLRRELAGAGTSGQPIAFRVNDAAKLACPPNTAAVMIIGKNFLGRRVS